MNIRVTNPSKRPDINAPMTLVAANVMPRRTREVIIVPSIPTMIAKREVHTQPFNISPLSFDGLI